MLYQTAPTGLCFLDVDLRVVRINDKLAEIHGRPVAEHLGLTVSEVIPELADQIVPALRKAIETGEPEANLEISGSNPADPETRATFLGSIYPLKLPDGKVHGLSVVVTDLTDRKRTEEALQQSQKLESLGVLAGGIAHDFNNLLTGILGNASLAKSKLTVESPVRGNIEQLELAASRAAELTHQMLAYSGMGTLAVAPVEITQLVQETGQLLTASISKKAELNWELAKDLPRVLADATQVRQVVMNLLMNASDALEDREGSITVRTDVDDSGPQLHFASSVWKRSLRRREVRVRRGFGHRDRHGRRDQEKNVRSVLLDEISSAADWDSRRSAGS